MNKECLDEAIKNKDQAYWERNQLVLFLTKLYPSYIGDHEHKEGESWDPEWLTVIYIDSPAGQLSWHIHSSLIEQFKHLPKFNSKWDGHTTEEKYKRLASLTPRLASTRVFRNEK